MCDTHRYYVINIYKQSYLLSLTSSDGAFVHIQVIKMSWLHLLPSALCSQELLALSTCISSMLYVCLTFPILPLHCPKTPQPIPSSPLSLFPPVFFMPLYQEEKRGSPEGLWFVPAAAYTGLMRSLREGVSVSVYVCMCLFLCLCLCSCD